MTSIIKRLPPLTRSRKPTITELVAVSESNLKRTGNERIPSLRKFSWQHGFDTEQNMTVIASLASLCGRGNLYDKIGNGALTHQS